MSLSFREVKNASDTEVARMIDVLTDAFLTYHAHTDMWGDDRELTKTLMTATVNFNLKTHETWIAERDGEIVAVSLWVPPGSEWIEDKDVETVFGPVLASITEELGGWILGEMFPGTEALQASVSPGCGRAWAYLAMFGVDPKLQGQGIGSAFLQHERKRITGPIGLSTQTEKNIRFYEKNGFVVRAERVYTLPNGNPWHDRFMVSVE